MTIEARHTTLPPDAPDKIISTPTMNRYNPNGEPIGHLPRWIITTQNAMSREGYDKDSWMIVGDASDIPDTDNLRMETLQHLDTIPNLSRLYFLTPELQKQVAQEVTDRTHLRADIVNAILAGTEYGQQRVKLDVVSGGIMMAGGHPLKLLMMDDDVVMPPRFVVVKDNAFEGLSRLPNSQIVFQHDGKDYPEDVFERNENPGLHPFFGHLGKTIGEIRNQHPTMRATSTWSDTMHVQLEDALRKGAAQFVVTHSKEDDLPGVDEAIAIAASATKSNWPDYRTVRIAQSNLEAEFPFDETPMRSFPSGPKVLFAFQYCDTNVDSAAFSRLINEKTALWPWWFVSSVDISLANPLQTVTASYRADNELLPVLLRVVLDRTGEKFMYLSGLNTQVLHNRAKTGYRPDLPTRQAPASLVGNIAALEAARILEFDPVTGIAKMPIVDRDYHAPDDQSYRVFNEIVNLAKICVAKQYELETRLRNTLDPNARNQIARKIERYIFTRGELEMKLAGMNYCVWKYHLDKEIREQLNFFQEVIEAMPSVTHEVGNLIAEGRYPVIEFVKSGQPSVSYPGSPTKAA